MIDPIVQSDQTLLEVPRAALEGVVRELERDGYFVAVVDRAPVFNQETLMHALYQSCRFPAYFGFNWDAVADCLTDFSWAEGKGYFLVFNDWPLLQSEAPDEARTLLEIAADAGRVWAEEGKVLRVLAAA
ncbi:MAG: barstar family protein [Meiothermus sp.]|nr:barstar family protein [Meiothermus sp.]